AGLGGPLGGRGGARRGSPGGSRAGAWEGAPCPGGRPSARRRGLQLPAGRSKIVGVSECSNGARLSSRRDPNTGGPSSPTAAKRRRGCRHYTSGREPQVRTQWAAQIVANFGLKSGTRIIELLVSL